MLSKEEQKALSKKILLKEYPKNNRLINLSKEEENAICNKVRQENILTHFSSIIEKFYILFKKYGIDKNNNETRWLLLSLKLAEEYIPGFKTEVEGGRKTKTVKWTPTKYARLYADVEKKRLEKKQTVSTICNNLPKNDKFYKNETNLNRRYSEAKDSIFIQLFNNIEQDVKNKTGYRNMILELLSKFS